MYGLGTEIARMVKELGTGVALEEEIRKLRRDANRYRWLRKQNWNESELCVVAQPAVAVRLGHDCPTLDRLDEAVDSLMREQGANV